MGEVACRVGWVGGGGGGGGHRVIYERVYNRL